MIEINSGAEARIYRNKEVIVKKRIVKKYRNPVLDCIIRKKRNRKEIKILEKLKNMSLNVPNLISFSDFEIEMEFIDGKKVRDCLTENLLEITKQIGVFIAELHNNNIIHGDLTTSNMIYFNKKVYFIDFGLSFTSLRVEDKAVDLHLLKQALESYHFKVWEKAFSTILLNYQLKSTNYEKIYERFLEVEKRGRNKH